MLNPSAYFHVPVRLRLTHEETEIMLGLISRFMLAGWHAQLSREEMIWMSVDGQGGESLPVYRDVCAIPPPTPTTTANLPTRPSRFAMAVAACCCGVPMPASDTCLAGVSVAS